ncbi:MAG: hypothetical protein ACREOE_03215, partial [Gemmatimonadales bacterium]
FSTVQFLDVIWTGTRFVATVTGPGPGDGGTFAESDDGIQWHLRAADNADWQPEHLASGPSGIVAVGTIAGALASWSSPDGLTWTPSAKGLPLPSLGTATAYVGGVTPSATGWVAVGRREPACNIDCGANPDLAYVWTSTDGLVWTRVPDQSSLKGGGMAAVTRAASGFVAAGVSAGHAAVWASADGTTWTRLPDSAALHEAPTPNGPLPATATGVATIGGLIAVVGAAYAQDGCDPGGKVALCPGGRAWWSADGKVWSKGSMELPINGQIAGVAATPTGLVAVGSGDACTGGIWATTDGKTWSCDAKDPSIMGFTPYAAATSGGLEVVVGLTSAGWDGTNAEPGSVWLRELP